MQPSGNDYKKADSERRLRVNYHDYNAGDKFHEEKSKFVKKKYCRCREGVRGLGAQRARRRGRPADRRGRPGRPASDAGGSEDDDVYDAYVTYD